MSKFGYNSCRWIRQNWKFVTYSGRVIGPNGNPVKSFSFTSKCGARGGRRPDGTVRLCLPDKVIKRLIRSKKGRDALHKQVRAKERAAKGVRVRYNDVVAQVFEKFQDEDKFQDSQKGPGTGSCRPVLDEKTVQLRLFE